MKLCTKSCRHSLFVYTCGLGDELAFYNFYSGTKADANLSRENQTMKVTRKSYYLFVCCNPDIETYIDLQPIVLPSPSLLRILLCVRAYFLKSIFLKRSCNTKTKAGTSIISIFIACYFSPISGGRTD